MEDQLKGVQCIQATDLAFAAIREDGRVVAWGAAKEGGDLRAVEELKSVRCIQASSAAFAAIQGDGSVDNLGRC